MVRLSRHCFQMFLVVCLTAAFALPQQPTLSTERQMAVEYAVNHFMVENSIAGISVALVENGEFEWAHGFGMADLENSVPATPHTLYRLASISKPITAVAALQLWQRGKLDLDAPIQKYCPSFPEKQAPITTRLVLGHLAGIRHYKSGSQSDPEIGNTLHFDNPIAAGLDFFKNDPLIDAPGHAFHYSTQGFTLVGCAIEGAAGEKYVDFVRENVFAPAGMTHTINDDRIAIIPDRTRFYSQEKTAGGAVKIVNADFLDSSYKIPGGGWLSSAEDMARFEVAILNDRLLSRATRDVMWTRQKTSDGKQTDYALGWGIGNNFGSLDAGHAGGQQGTSTYILLVPERRAGVVVLMNVDGADSSALAGDLMKILLAPKAD